MTTAEQIMDDNTKTPFEKAHEMMDAGITEPPPPTWADFGKSKRRSVSDIIEAANLARRPHVVEGLIPSGAITLISGEPKVGKTTIIASILDAMDVSEGSMWAGRKVNHGRAWVYIDEGLMSLAELLEDVGPGTDSQHSFSMVSEWVNLTWQMIANAIVEDFKATPLEERPSAIIIDTLGRWTEIDDMNSYSKAVQSFKFLQYIRDATGCAVIPITHSRKDRKDISDIGTVSGSSAFSGQADNILTVSKTHDEENEPDNNIRLINVYGRFRNSIPRIAVRYETGTFVSDEVPFGSMTQTQVREMKDAELFEHIKQSGSITVSQTRDLMGCGRGAAQNALSRLVSANLIKHNGHKNANSAYLLLNVE